MKASLPFSYSIQLAQERLTRNLSRCFVARDSANNLVLLNIYRAGANAVYVQYIEYVNKVFKLVREEPMQ